MDDSEIEITPLNREPGSDLHRLLRPPRPRLARNQRLVLAAASVLVTVVVILSVWLPLRATSSSTSTALGYPSPTPRPTATHVLLPTPLPITGGLGTPPQHCLAAPALDTITVPAFDGFIGSTVQMSGRAPVWVPESTLPQGFVDLSPPSSTPYWPAAEIFWAIGPKSHPTVTVRAFSLETGETAWWGLSGDNPQVPVLVISPSLDYPTAASWVTYRTFLIITHAGCYELQVTWEGGGWYTIFSAGQTNATPPG